MSPARKRRRRGLGPRAPRARGARSPRARPRGPRQCRRPPRPGRRGMPPTAFRRGSRTGGGVGEPMCAVAAVARPRGARAPVVARRVRGLRAARRVAGCLVLAHGAEDRKPGRRRQGPGRSSGATISSRRPVTMASRASSLKLIRDVATRDPNGITRATRVSSAWRMRVGGRSDLVVGVQVEDRGHVVRLDLHRPQDAAKRGVEGVFGGLDLDGLPGVDDPRGDPGADDVASPLGQGLAAVLPMAVGLALV